MAFRVVGPGVHPPAWQSGQLGTGRSETARTPGRARLPQRKRVLTPNPELRTRKPAAVPGEQGNKAPGRQDAREGCRLRALRRGGGTRQHTTGMRRCGARQFSPVLHRLGTGSAESGSSSAFPAWNATAEKGGDAGGNNPAHEEVARGRPARPSGSSGISRSSVAGGPTRADNRGNPESSGRPRAARPRPGPSPGRAQESPLPRECSAQKAKRCWGARPPDSWSLPPLSFAGFCCLVLWVLRKTFLAEPRPHACAPPAAKPTQG